MDKIKKLLQKIGQKDRQRLLSLIADLIAEKSGLNIQKIKSSDFYRLRSGRFRVIFHKDAKSKKVIIDSIKLRDKDTYK